jgi:putative ABC transport system substrate-binding protein
VTALREGLQALGWTAERNLHFEERWIGNDMNLLQQSVQEMVALTPDLIVTGNTRCAQLMRRAPRPIPTVFVGIADPVGGGVIDSMARPGGNVTGFTAFEYAIGGKWLSLLKELSPTVERVALLFNASTEPWAESFWRVFESSAPQYGIKPIRMDVHDAAEIERALQTFAREPNGGLIGVPAVTMALHHELLVRMTAQHRIPAIYPYRYFPAQGGLASYGIDINAMWRQSASYVDRILKGANPADLPAQAPTKFEFIVNLKTARALGLNLPPTLIASADEVIE